MLGSAALRLSVVKDDTRRCSVSHLEYRILVPTAAPCAIVHADGELGYQEKSEGLELSMRSPLLVQEYVSTLDRSTVRGL